MGMGSSFKEEEDFPVQVVHDLLLAALEHPESVRFITACQVGQRISNALKTSMPSGRPS